MDSGTYTVNHDRTVYVWPEDADMPSGFRKMSPDRPDEAVKWDDESDAPERTPAGLAVSIRRGQVVAYDADGNLTDSFELSDEDAVESFNRRYRPGGDGAVPLEPSDADESESELTSNPAAQPTEQPSPDVVRPGDRPLNESERAELERLRAGH